MIPPYLQRFEYCVRFWISQYKMDAKVLERIQRMVAKLIKGLEGMSYEDELRMGDCSLEE